MTDFDANQAAADFMKVIKRRGDCPTHATAGFISEIAEDVMKKTGSEGKENIIFLCLLSGFVESCCEERAGHEFIEKVLAKTLQEAHDNLGLNLQFIDAALVHNPPETKQ